MRAFINYEDKTSLEFCLHGLILVISEIIQLLGTRSTACYKDKKRSYIFFFVFLTYRVRSVTITHTRHNWKLEQDKKGVLIYSQFVKKKNWLSQQKYLNLETHLLLLITKDIIDIHMFHVRDKYELKTVCKLRPFWKACNFLTLWAWSQDSDSLTWQLDYFLYLFILNNWVHFFTTWSDLLKDDFSPLFIYGRVNSLNNPFHFHIHCTKSFPVCLPYFLCLSWIIRIICVYWYIIASFFCCNALWVITCVSIWWVWKRATTVDVHFTSAPPTVTCICLPWCITVVILSMVLCIVPRSLKNKT